jgi:hypothetical protein
MTTYSPTVADVSRAVAFLDENACSDADIVHAATRRVARNLAYQFARHGWAVCRGVNTRDVRAVLIAHGASALTVEQFARRISAAIRADFSDGMRP